MKLDESLESRLIREADDDGVVRIVVAAVVERNGWVLLLRRRHGDFMGGIYELPSGVVEDGETLAQALCREVEEETGLLVGEISDYLGCFDYLSGSCARTRQFNFLVTVSRFPFIRLTEHDAFIWAGRSGLERLRITEAVRKVLDHPVLKEFRSASLP